MSIGDFASFQQWATVRADRLRSLPRFSGYGLLVAAALITVSLVIIVPTYLLIRTTGAGEATLETLRSLRTWQTMGNTLLLTVSVVLASTVIAVPMAWLTTWTDLPGRRVWALVGALPLVVPSYVAAYLYASLLSPKGPVQQALEPWLGIDRLPPFTGFPGAFFVLTLISYPFIYLTVRAALQRLDPALLEASRSLGQTPRQTFWRVTVPVLRPSLIAGSLLVALYCLRDFGAVNLLQYSTFTRIIYNRYQAYRLDEAAAMALLLVVLAAVLLYMDHRSRDGRQYARVSVGCARQRPVIHLGRWTVPALLFMSAIIFLALVVPAGGLVYWFWRGLNQDWLVRELGPATTNVGSLTALARPALNSLTASLAAAVLTVLLALPVALLAVRHPGPLSRAMERLAYTSSALPGIVVALAYVFVGTNMAQSLYQTLPLMLAAYAVLFLPQAIGAERASLLQISSSLEDAGRSLGQRPLQVFRRVTLPLLRPGLLAAAAMVFLTCMKELPATLILSPIGFETLAADVWANISEAFFARAAAPTLLLILLSSVPLALLTLRDAQDR
jgi:iron(III) transport system permease protein